jgi:hypothetical protein
MTLNLSKERRPSVTASITSTQSAMSMQSDMSMNTKLSLSKRLRKVFSMSNLRSDNSSLKSLSERNGSNSSISSTTSSAATMESSPLSQHQTSGNERTNPMSFRRRSIASLSSLFQKGASAPSIESLKSTSPTPTSNKSNSNSKKPVKESTSTSRRHSSGDLRSLVKKEEKKDKRPDLRVDTTEVTTNVRKGGLKGKIIYLLCDINRNN